MGKRELLIILGFVAAGVVVYQIAAPPNTSTGRGFSLTNFVASMRRDIRGNRANASVTTTGTIALEGSVAEVRLSNVTRVKVTGESRSDIGYELTVESNGPDEGAARENATKATLVQDVVGPVLTLRPSSTSARNLRQVTGVVLTVPARLAIRVSQGGTHLEVANVAAVQLDGVVGDVRLTRVNGSVSGTHRNGELGVTDAGAVNLTLVSTKASFESIRGATTINARNGGCRVIDARGLVEIDVVNEEVTLVRPTGPVRVGGNGGKLSIEDPQDAVQIDVRRMSVDATIARAVPLTVIATDEPLRLSLTGTPAIALEAVAVDGKIDASDFSLTPETTNEDSRLRHTFGAGTAPVALRNQRGEIVIRQTK